MLTHWQRHGKRIYFLGAMSQKWVPAEKFLREKTLIERGYQVKRLTPRQAKKLNEAIS